jgi:hypothetical protein
MGAADPQPAYPIAGRQGAAENPGAKSPARFSRLFDQSTLQ